MFHARYRCVDYASNAFDALLRHPSVHYMRVPILQDFASVACPKRVWDARWNVFCAPVARA